MNTTVLQAIKPEDIEQAAVQAAQALQAGALVGFATETVYGIAALATNLEAMERLREIKSRPSRPFSLHLAEPQAIAQYVQPLSQVATRLMAKAMPGPITLLLPTGGRLADPSLQEPGLYARLVSDDILGVRCPDQPLAQSMLARVEGPVVAPSANLTGKASPRSAQDVLDNVGGLIDLVVDSGPTLYGKDSTIVDLTTPDWKIVRPGVYDERMIRNMLRRVYLFVCTGNTCRSPIAAGIAARILAQQLGVPQRELEAHGVDVISAGTYAASQSPATPEAIQAAAEHRADISEHRSRRLTTELIRGADMIFCMTESHVAQVLELDKQAQGKVVRLSEQGDIADPVGGAADVYRAAAEQIETALIKRLNEGMP